MVKFSYNFEDISAGDFAFCGIVIEGFDASADFNGVFYYLLGTMIILVEDLVINLSEFFLSFESLRFSLDFDFNFDFLCLLEFNESTLITYSF